MRHVGIDLEQFVTDPYTSGIQRVLQYLAREWPMETATCAFVVPWEDGYLLLTPEQASTLIDPAFDAADTDSMRAGVWSRVQELSNGAPRVSASGMLGHFDSWLMPEVSYLPQVLERLTMVQESMPCVMIGYDALPMTDPSNYRFRPGTAARVSDYFRRLSSASSVVCISEYSRQALLRRLRRDPGLPISVAHPGGDHIPASMMPRVAGSPIHFLRVGTLESRKRPQEVAEAFLAARRIGINARLTFIGRPSASDARLNRAVLSACVQDPAIEWIESATDEYVRHALAGADVFLSVGTEGYGIPVLEAIRLGTPVLFGGIQPAGDIMVGHGSRDLGDPSIDDLVQAFTTYSDASEASALRSEVEPEAVPRWRDFTHAVARACVG